MDAGGRATQERLPRGTNPNGLKCKSKVKGVGSRTHRRKSKATDG